MWGNLEELKSAAAATTSRALTEKDPNSGPRNSQSLAIKSPAAKAHVPPASSAQPFECCIKEYGVRIKKGDEARGDFDPETAWTGWQARWRMFGTAIM